MEMEQVVAQTYLPLFTFHYNHQSHNTKNDNSK